jgi:hypothetical protein
MSEPQKSEDVKASAPKKKERTPIEKAAAMVLGALQDPKSEAALEEIGASLFCAHMQLDLGDTKFLDLTPSTVRAYAESWRRNHAMAWPAVQMGNTVSFVRYCEMYGIEHPTAEDYATAMQRVNPPVRPTGF